MLRQLSVRQTLLAISLACVGALAFGLYLQNMKGVVPCPMCIVQRYAMLSVGILAGLGALSAKRGAQIAGTLLVMLAAGFGAFVAARQSWLQWYPPEVVSCGRDFYGMIANFPLQRVIPMVFRGSGDCSKVDWTFLGGSLANWSFLSFVVIVLISIGLIARSLRAR